MANAKFYAYEIVGDAHLGVRRIEPADLKSALSEGLADFVAMPTFSIFLVFLYPLAGLLLFWLIFELDLLQLLFPLIIGFALLGPLAAIGLYELSRRREQGLGVAPEALKDIHFPCIRDITLLGVVMMAIFFLWLVVALAVYQQTFGNWVPSSFVEFAGRVLTTSTGWALIVAGCSAALIFGVAAFAISVVSVPLLLERNVGFATAVRTSIQAVLASPATMALWGLIVTGALMLGSLPFLIGLAVVFPILGHATWHLYRAVVEP